MAEYVKATICAEPLLLEKGSDGKWAKEIRAPSMPGEYKVELEVGLPEGGLFSCEAEQRVVVTGKIFDMGQYGKLSEKLIKRIIMTCYGFAAHVLLEDSTIHVLVRMDCHDVNVLTGISCLILPKIPAHLNLSVRRYPVTWEQISRDFYSWNSVKERFQSWQDVYNYMPRHLLSWKDIIREYSSWQKVKEGFRDWKLVMLHNSDDYAIWNEIKTGFRTWVDVYRRYESWDDAQIYTHVEPLREVYDYARKD